MDSQSSIRVALSLDLRAGQDLEKSRGQGVSDRRRCSNWAGNLPEGGRNGPVKLASESTGRWVLILERGSPLHGTGSVCASST